jgi:hypothetical protein
MISVTAICLFSVGVLAQTRDRGGAQYDGKWWLSISAKEQDGFVSGFYDCYTYEYKGPDRYTVKSFAEYRRLITGYYQNDTSKKNLPVSEVMHQFRDRPGEKPATGGETTRGQHGYFDGLYWKQISALGGKEKEVGFIEGYLSCHSELVRDRGGVFSKPPADYAELITQWYGLKEDTGDIDEKREPAKVANVLFKFRDGAASQKGAKND